MKITLSGIRNGTVPLDQVRAFAMRYDNVDPETLPAEECEAVHAALNRLLQPMPGTPAAALADAFNGRVTVLPVLTCAGARIASVEQTTIDIGRDDEGSQLFVDMLVFTYDDGIRQAVSCELGDNGFSLVLDGDGNPAFFTALTSDGEFDIMCSAKEAGLKYDVLLSIHTIARDRLHLFTGDVDAVAIANEPRTRSRDDFDRRVAPKPMTIRQLYETPPTPRGRAPLGRPRG